MCEAQLRVLCEEILWVCEELAGTIDLFSRGADKVTCQETHSGHIVLSLMPALTTGTGGLAGNSPWK